MSTVTQAIAQRDSERRTSPAAALAIRPGQDMWDPKQEAALTQLGIKGATRADLAVFLHYCQKTGLDPFSRQIYMIERAGKQTIQVGIDGFRVIRDRAARRDHVTVEYRPTIWYDHDGAEHTVWLTPDPPAACRVDILKDGALYPGVARTAAYMQTSKTGDPAAQWRTQPDHMIEKVAEAFALRRAFPHDLGGLYTDDEMPAPPPPAAPRRPRPARSAAPPAEPAESFETARPPQDVHLPPIPEDGVKATPDQIKHMHALFGDAGWGKDKRIARLAAVSALIGTVIGSFNDLTRDMADTAIGYLEALHKRTPDPHAYADALEAIAAGK